MVSVARFLCPSLLRLIFDEHPCYCVHRVGYDVFGLSVIVALNSFEMVGGVLGMCLSSFLEI